MQYTRLSGSKLSSEKGGMTVCWPVDETPPQHNAMDPIGILARSPDVIGKVLKDKFLPRQHHVLMVQCLQRWERHMLPGDEMKDARATAHNNEEPTNPKYQQILSLANEIALQVRLNLIVPSKLVGLVSSELFAKEQIYE
jgi:hypothetical protein